LTLSGIPKSILLSVMDMIVYKTSITSIQAVGYTIAAAGTYHYSQISNNGARRIMLDERKADPLHKRVGDEESQLLNEKTDRLII